MLQVDYGSILLETEDASIDESLTGNDTTSYLLDEVDGDRNGIRSGDQNANFVLPGTDFKLKVLPFGLTKAVF